MKVERLGYIEFPSEVRKCYRVKVTIARPNIFSEECNCSKTFDFYIKDEEILKKFYHRLTRTPLKFRNTSDPFSIISRNQEIRDGILNFEDRCYGGYITEKVEVTYIGAKGLEWYTRITEEENDKKEYS